MKPLNWSALPSIFPHPAFCEYKARGRHVDPERLKLRSELRRLFKESPGSAGSRALMSMKQELGHKIGRFKVRSLMKGAG